MDFEDDRKQFVKMFNGDVAKAQKATSPLFDKDTVRRLLDESYNEKIGQQTKTRLNWYVNGGQERAAYYNILSRMGLNYSSVKTAIDDWGGSYRYFRYFSKSSSSEDIEYNNGEGRILIEKENNISIFKHWSHNCKTEEPEHSGYVYVSGSSIFMLGVGKGRMRLSIAMKVESPKEEKIIGIVLSQKNPAPYLPFSARYIMVSDKNKVLYDNLSDRTPVEYEIDGKLIRSTIGQKNFHHEVGGGEYAYFMVASHT